MCGHVIKHLHSWRWGAGTPVSSSGHGWGGTPAWAPSCGPQGAAGGGASHAKRSCGRHF